MLGARHPVGRPGPSLPSLQLPCPPISIDTRTMRCGQWYVAIVGDRFDGHDFVPDALQKGASVIIHSRPIEAGSRWQDRLFVQVEDTRRALRCLARLAREQWGNPVVAVTGSMGKTTTRQFASTLLAQQFSVFQSPGNWNNEIGVPLSLMQLTEEHDLALLELAMNHAGEIGLLAATCSPDTALVTNVAEVHLEFFSNLDEIAEAKGELLAHLRPPGTLVFNLDDPKVANLAKRHDGRCVSFGFSPGADVGVADCRIESLSSMQLRLELQGDPVRSRVPFAGRHFAYNVAAAAALSLTHGLSVEQIRQGLKFLKAFPMRGAILRLDNGGERVTVWDDSYNSNPRAAEAVLETIRDVTGFRRKILVLGEMLELGPESPNLHRQVGRVSASTRPDLVVAVGEGAQGLVEGAVKAGLKADRICHFTGACAAADFLTGQVRGGDLVLVKGSRGVRMDRIVGKLKEVFPA